MMRFAMLLDGRFHLGDCRIIDRIGPQPPKKGCSILDRMPLCIIREGILDNGMDRPLFAPRQLMREIARAGGADGELG